jgi:hypothetical protein
LRLLAGNLELTRFYEAISAFIEGLRNAEILPA